MSQTNHLSDATCRRPSRDVSSALLTLYLAGGKGCSAGSRGELAKRSGDTHSRLLSFDSQIANIGAHQRTATLCGYFAKI